MSRREKDTNPLDPAGRVSFRAWAQSGTSDGKPLPTQPHHMDVPCDSCGTRRADCPGPSSRYVCCESCWHPDTQPVQETQAYAPAPIDDRVEAEASLQRQRDKVYALSLLTDDEREAWEQRTRQDGWVTRSHWFAASERDDKEKLGWSFVERDRHGRVKMSVQVASPPTYEQIAERMSITPERVHSLLKSVRRKMRTPR